MLIAHIGETCRQPAACGMSGQTSLQTTILTPVLTNMATIQFLTVQSVIIFVRTYKIFQRLSESCNFFLGVGGVWRISIEWRYYFRNCGPPAFATVTLFWQPRIISGCVISQRAEALNFIQANVAFGKLRRTFCFVGMTNFWTNSTLIAVKSYIDL